ncbi:hypothetical protein Tco_1362186 [Tanacetum coccineum]
MIHDGYGNMYEGDEVAEQFVRHLHKFLGEDVQVKHMENINIFIKNKLSEDEANEMVRDVSDANIKEAMFLIDGNKALGPDGFSSLFFKSAWNIVGEDVCKAIKEFFVTRMVDWIIKCVSTTSFSICVNGERFGYFKGGKGLRQGDPVSMKLTHLGFADDLLMFCHGDMNYFNVVKEAIKDFYRTWPSEWVEKYPNLSPIQNVVIDEFKQDEMNIPKHAFILWMTVQESIATQDKIKSWGSYDMMLRGIIDYSQEKKGVSMSYMQFFIETIRLRLSSLKDKLTKAVTKARQYWNVKIVVLLRVLVKFRLALVGVFFDGLLKFAVAGLICLSFHKTEIREGSEDVAAISGSRVYGSITNGVLRLTNVETWDAILSKTFGVKIPQP